MSKDVKISPALLNQIIDVLECFEPDPSDPILSYCLKYVLSTLLKKKQLLNSQKS